MFPCPLLCLFFSTGDTVTRPEELPSLVWVGWIFWMHCWFTKMRTLLMSKLFASHSSPSRYLRATRGTMRSFPDCIYVIMLTHHVCLSLLSHVFVWLVWATETMHLFNKMIRKLVIYVCHLMPYQHYSNHDFYWTLYAESIYCICQCTVNELL